MFNNPPGELGRDTSLETTMPSSREVFLYFTKLGFINIGGPVAQITMMFNHMVERAGWLSEERFVKIMGFVHMLPGPEALQLAIYVGYLKRGILGGIIAGLTFILPGAAIMVLLSWAYAGYGRLPQVNDVLYVLKPAVIGIIAVGILKLGRAAIKNKILAILALGAFLGMYWGGMNILAVLVIAGVLNTLLAGSLPPPGSVLNVVPPLFLGLGWSGLMGSRAIQISWLSIKTGLFSFGGAYASLAFLQRGAVEQYRWISAGQLLDGVALSMATPGPFMLFTTFVGFLAGGLPGAVLATFFVFLPSFVLVLVGAPYIELIQHNRPIQDFLAGASAAVVGVILGVSLSLVPEAFSGLATVAVAAAVFITLILFKIDVAYMAVGCLAAGALYALIRAV